MPVKPEPFVIECTICGWKQLSAPSSDVLRADEHPEHCPDCGSHLLDVRPPNFADCFKSFFGLIGRR